MDNKIFQNEILPKILKIPKFANFINDNNITIGELMPLSPFLSDELQRDKNDPYDVVLEIDKKRSISITFVLKKNFTEIPKKGRIISKFISPIDSEIRIEDFSKNKEEFKPVMIELKKIVLNFFSKDENKTLLKGFYLHGPSGIGKSFLLKAMVNFFASRGKNTAYINTSDAVEFFRLGKNKDQTFNIAKDLREADFLVFDDLGGEPIYEWFRDEFLINILNYRRDKHLLTCFTSNYDIKELEKIEAKSAYNVDLNRSKRLIQRILDLSNQIFVNAKNLN